MERPICVHIPNPLELHISIALKMIPTIYPEKILDALYAQTPMDNTEDKSKKWMSICGKCNRNTFYSRKDGIRRFIKNGKLCRSCAHKGIPKSEEHKRNIGISHIGLTPTKETRLKMSVNRKGKGTGKNNHWYGKNRSGPNNPNFGKTGSKCAWFGRRHTEETKKKIADGHLGIRPSDSSRLKMRMAAIKRIKEKGVQPYTNYNPNACVYFDKLNQEKGWNLQHALNGGEVEIYGYFIDAYDKKKNIIVEYDEKKHFGRDGNLKPKDIQRQKDIIEFLSPTQFWRYNTITNQLNRIL